MTLEEAYTTYCLVMGGSPRYIVDEIGKALLKTNMSGWAEGELELLAELGKTLDPPCNGIVAYHKLIEHEEKSAHTEKLNGNP